MAHRITDILKMHRAPLDQGANTYHRIKRPRRRGVFVFLTLEGQIGGGGGEEVRSGLEEHAGAGLLCLPGLDHLLRCVGEFVGAGHGLEDYVFVLDTGGCEGFLGAGDEGVDDFGVPAGVDYADAEVGAWEVLDGVEGGVGGGIVVPS